MNFTTVDIITQINEFRTFFISLTHIIDPFYIYIYNCPSYYEFLIILIVQKALKTG
jgi:hypothetical protein